MTARLPKKRVYLFPEGNAGMRDLLGGKGANLCEMTNLGEPVPPGFVISTQACNRYLATGRFPPGLWPQTLAALKSIEREIGRRFGDPQDPLLVSVRSGARFSQPPPAGGVYSHNGPLSFIGWLALRPSCS